jgi:ketosteroid isomerase-like protein
MSQENVEIVRRCYAALDRRDWEGLWREAHPDFELRTQLQGSRLGPDEAQAFIEDQFAAFEPGK